MLHLDLQRGKENMKDVEFVSTHIKTAACTGRLIKNTCKMAGGKEEEEENEEEEEEEKTARKEDTFLGDAWFGSVDSCIIARELKSHFICVVKTVHNRYPKQWIEQAMAHWPPGSNLVLQANIEGVDLVAIGYKYSQRKVLCFLCTKGAGSTLPGEPYVAKWKDSRGNMMAKHVARPKVISKYFAHSNKVDVHNQSRQSDLALEEHWVTRDGFFRINTSLVGITVVDAWRAYRHHMHPNHRHKDIPLMEFVSVLTKDLLRNKLTRKVPALPTAFNIMPNPDTVSVRNPAIDQEEDSRAVAETAAFQMTQESIVDCPAAMFTDDEALENALASSLEDRRSSHGLIMNTEMTTEVVEEKDADGTLKVKQNIRRKRGICNYCKHKTFWFCPVCPPKPRASKHWCCGPSQPNGHVCNAKHDSSWCYVEAQEAANKSE